MNQQHLLCLKTSRQHTDRRGNVLVLTVLGLIPFFALVALAVDLGVLSLAQTQCQNAADWPP